MRSFGGFVVIVLVSSLIACVGTKSDNELSLLEKAVMQDSLDAASVLLISGVNPNQKSRDGSTAIFLVQSREMVNLLVGYGADVNALNNKKQTAIFNVFKPEVLQALLTAGADVNVVDINGFTLPGLLQGFIKMTETNPEISRDESIKNMRQRMDVIKNHGSLSVLLSYARAGKLVELKTVVEKRMSLDDVDNKGNTALHLAAKNSHDYVVRYLLNKKPSLMVKNKEGKTPLDLVRGRKNSTAKILSCVQNKNCVSVVSFEKNLAKACDLQGDIERCFEAVEKDIHGVFITPGIESRIAKLGYKK